MTTVYRAIAALMIAALPFTAKAQKNIEALRAAYDSLGNVSGAYLFPKEEGANLRILKKTTTLTTRISY